MQLIVMETCSDPEGWTTSNYKNFKRTDNDPNSETDDDDEDDQEGPVVRGYSGDKYKKILFIEELLPE